MEKLKVVRAVSCDRCKKTWIPRVRQPVKCPSCGHRFGSRISKRVPQKRNIEVNG